MIVVVPAVPGDAGEILTVQLAGFVSEARLLGEADIPPLRDTVADVAAAIAADLVLVARDVADGVPGRVVGTVRLAALAQPASTPLAESAGYLGRLAVAPDRRRAGIAGRLIDAALVAAVGRFARVELVTARRSGQNVAMYRRRGWRELPAGSGYPAIDDVGIEIVAMSRDVPAATLRTRELRPDLDSTVVADLWAAASVARWQSGGIGPGSDPSLLVRLGASMTDRPGVFGVLVEQAGRPVAVAVATPALALDGAGDDVVPGLAHISGLCTDPVVWGRGAGAAAVAGICAAAADRSMPRVQLAVDEDNGRAKALYARLGFVAEDGWSATSRSGALLERWSRAAREDDRGMPNAVASAVETAGPDTGTVTTEAVLTSGGAGRYAARRDRVRALLAPRELDALLVSDLVNVRYLTGFSGTNALLVLGAEPAADVFLTDPRYVVQAARQVPDLTRVVEQRTFAAAARVVARLGTGSAVGLETHVLTVDDHERLRELVAGLADDPGAANPGPRLISARRPVEEIRAVKDDAELDLLRRACAISAAALGQLVAGAAGPLAGRSERDVAAALDALLRDGGADGPAFETIVASGPNSASPHHDPGDRVLLPGDLVIVDFGALVDGYHADMTRTLFVRGAPVVRGPGVPAEPADWQREIHAAVRDANAAATAASVAGAGLATVDTEARRVIGAAGFAQFFTHGLGHGVGLAVHEEPFFSSTSTGNLEPGMPVTIEPGIYLTGRGGVRIEDTVIVRTKTGIVGGGPEILTVLTRDLIPVD